MGLYDSVKVICPNCKKEHFFQTKSGYCTMGVFELEYAPDQVLIDINRHAPVKCECGTKLVVINSFEGRKVLEVK